MSEVLANHLASRSDRLAAHSHTHNRWTSRSCMVRVAIVFALGLLLAAAPAAAQKKKKTPPADSSLTLPLPDEQQVDYTISEMLGAWQLGDVEKMHKDYGDDVIVVNGIYAPPVIGWSNYLATYQQQRARMQRVRLDRANTYIKVDGDVAWACYQWDFSALADEQTATAQGQTTLVLNKRDGHWVIVLNHTSLVPSAPPQPATTQPSNSQPLSSQPSNAQPNAGPPKTDPQTTSKPPAA
jgi:ketosteroid isomerase-like protein